MNVDTTQKLSLHNRQSIQCVDEASCYFCLRTYPSKLVIEWIDDGQTALCPHCDIDAVLPGKIPQEELIKLCEHWFCGITITKEELGV